MSVAQAVDPDKADTKFLTSRQSPIICQNQTSCSSTKQRQFTISQTVAVQEGRIYKTVLIFGVETIRMLKIIQRFDRQCSCHLLCVYEDATAMCTVLTDNSPHSQQVAHPRMPNLHTELHSRKPKGKNIVRFFRVFRSS